MKRGTAEISSRDLVRFFEALPEPLRAELVQDPDLPAALTEGYRNAQKCFTSFRVTPADFFSFLGKKVAFKPEAWQTIVGKYCADLYLAQALEKRVPEALVAFQERHVDLLQLVFYSLNVPAAEKEDAQQIIWQKLFVGTAESSPKILQYGGLSSLSTWLRVTMTRMTTNLILKKRSLRESEEDLLNNLISPHAEPDLRYMKEIYQQQFRQAIGEAILQLSKRERTLLRMRILDGTPYQDLARLHQVSDRTVRNWMEKIRSSLFESVRRHFSARLKMGSEEFQSMVRLVQSRLQISLKGLDSSVGPNPKNSNDEPNSNPNS